MPPASKTIGAVGRTAEAKLAERLDGKCTPASGARDSKGDIKVGRFRLEAKATESASYGLKHDELAKITQEATAAGKYPAFAVLFVNPRGDPLRFGSWVAVPEHIFK